MSEHIERVRVTNRNPFMIKDMHDGVPYEFPPGATVVIPPEAAAHMFGWPGDELDMRQYMARRFGWNRPEYYTMPKDEQAAAAMGVPYPCHQLPWQMLTAGVTLGVEHYEVRRVREPGAPIPAEEASEAPDMLTINTDPPPPRRTVVGRRAKAKRKPRVKQLATASGPLHQSATQPSTITEAPTPDPWSVPDRSAT